MKKWWYFIVLILGIACKKQTKQNSVLQKHTDTLIQTNNKVFNAENTTLNKEQEDSIYKWFTPKEMGDLQIRTVKAINGLNVRDSLENKIAKLDFGQQVYILNYSKDSVAIKEKDKTIKGRKAKIVIKWSAKKTKVSTNKYAYAWYVKKEDVGFIFDGFLYKNLEETYDDSLYSYSYLSMGEQGEESKIDLREVLEIEKVPIKNFKVLEKQKDKNTAFKKIDGKIELSFKNGTKRILIDTTYLNSEYTPTRTYNVFEHSAFPNSYMVSERMFFMPEIHTELSKKNGDTLHVFPGYPYISPNKNYAVLITHDETECYHDTYFQVFKKDINNKYKSIFAYVPRSWSYPFIKNEAGSMDAVFSIDWLNQKTFIIKVVNYIEDCYAPDELSKPYYLKFEIKL